MEAIQYKEVSSTLSFCPMKTGTKTPCNLNTSMEKVGDEKCSSSKPLGHSTPNCFQVDTS